MVVVIGVGFADEKNDGSMEQTDGPNHEWLHERAARNVSDVLQMQRDALEAGHANNVAANSTSEVMSQLTSLEKQSYMHVLDVLAPPEDNLKCHPLMLEIVQRLPTKVCCMNQHLNARHTLRC